MKEIEARKEKERKGKERKGKERKGKKIPSSSEQTLQRNIYNAAIFVITSTYSVASKQKFPYFRLQNEQRNSKICKLGWSSGTWITLTLTKGHWCYTLAVVGRGAATRIWRNLLSVHDNRRSTVSRRL